MNRTRMNENAPSPQPNIILPPPKDVIYPMEIQRDEIGRIPIFVKLGIQMDVPIKQKTL
jgi:hypothetical protein